MIMYGKFWFFNALANILDVSLNYFNWEIMLQKYNIAYSLNTALCASSFVSQDGITYSLF